MTKVSERREKRSTQIFVKVRPSEREMLAAIARYERRTTSDMVRELIYREAERLGLLNGQAAA